MDTAKTKKIQGETAAILKRIEIGMDSKIAKILIKPILWMIAAIAVSGTEAVMGVAPFGIALICASEGFINTSAVMCGTALGSVGMGASALWQIFISLGIYITRFFISYIMKRKSFSIDNAFTEQCSLRVLSAAVASLAAGAVTVFQGGNVYVDIIYAVVGFALYPAFTYALILLLSTNQPQEVRLAGFCGIAYAVTLTLNQWALPFNAGVIFALGATILITYTNKPIHGSAVGIFCGMAMQAYYAPLYPLAAFTAGLIFKFSSAGGVICASLVSVCWAVRAGGFDAMSDLLPEVIFTCAILAPLANLGLLPKKELFSPPKIPDPPVYSKDKELEDKLGKLSVSLEDISSLLTQVSEQIQKPSKDEATRICSSARAKFCSSCVHKDICSGTEINETNKFFNALIKRLSEEGGASAGFVPPRIAARCHNIDKILDYTNTSAKIAGKLAAENCKTRLFASDYKAIASLLQQSANPEENAWHKDTESELLLKSSFAEKGIDISGVSVYGSRCKKIYYRNIALPNAAGEDDIRRESEKIVGGKLSSPDFTIDGSSVSAYLRSIPLYSLDIGRYSSAGDGEKYSGDTVTSFKNDDGFYYTLISDGMGSGKEAALTSGISAVFLEKLLSAGAPMKSSLELLNSFICGGESECFTTIDLMEADLYTGKTSFIKSGAAPSFVLRDGRVFRLHSKTVPVGIIRALDAEKITFEIIDGDMIVMLSDGVTGSYEACPWLYELLESKDISGSTPQKAAKLIGEAAEKATDRSDDITVAVMKVRKN